MEIKGGSKDLCYTVINAGLLAPTHQSAGRDGDLQNCVWKMSAQQKERYPEEEDGWKNMELTIPTEGMYRMWYVKTGVLKKKNPSSDIQTYSHTRGSKNYLQRKQSRVEGEILKLDWLSRPSRFPLLIPSAGSY